MSGSLEPKKLRKAIKTYREALAQARAAGDTSEGQLRHAFGHLLRTVAPLAGWEFHEETHDAAKTVRFDGVLKKNFLTRGVWEAKDTGDHLRTEVEKKRKKGYPLDNTLFEDTAHAIGPTQNRT